MYHFILKLQLDLLVSSVFTFLSDFKSENSHIVIITNIYNSTQYEL
jgi:hypothetical protein